AAQGPSTSSGGWSGARWRRGAVITGLLSTDGQASGLVSNGRVVPFFVTPSSVVGVTTTTSSSSDATLLTGATSGPDRDGPRLSCSGLFGSGGTHPQIQVSPNGTLSPATPTPPNSTTFPVAAS